ncbi:MAG: ankyrin repeat domain-containing protein [Actinomycetota bacterium]|nr:ankyrin repeat domain-containing protein [Actinomycetota bacterium]
MSGSLQPGDLYVHVADDGGILISPFDRRLSAWVTIERLAEEVQGVVARSRVIYLSTEGGSHLAAPASQLVHDAASSIAVAETDPLPETVREGGVTALISAAGVGATALLDDLMARGADLGQTADLGRTAVMAAASRGEVVTLRHLLDHGARLDTVDERGDTALTLATHFGHAEAVRVLLDEGADPDHRNNQGLDARSIADCQHHADVAAHLPAPAPGSAAGTPDRAPSARPDRWRFLRQPMVLEDAASGLVVRTADITVVRFLGLALAVVCLIIGGVAGKASDLLGGAIAAAFILTVSFTLAWVVGHSVLRVAGDSLQVRLPVGRQHPVDLGRVAAASFVTARRRVPALQLLQEDAGPHRTHGVQRWQGVTPPPTASDGRPLRCLNVALGPEYRRVLRRVAPTLLTGAAVLDDATRSELQAHLHGVD